MALTVLPAQACRILAVFPEHLERESLDRRDSFYVVQVRHAIDDAFNVVVTQSFGGPFQPGATTRMQFVQGEEAHAVCPIKIHSGQSYLVQAKVLNRGLVISRNNWMNVPASHEKFSVYVDDLRSSFAASKPRRR